MPLGPWLLASDIAETFGVTVRTARRWAQRGLLPSRVNPSGWRLFTADDVAALVPPSQQALPPRVWDRKCGEDGCEQPHHARGRCKPHDQQRRRLERGAGVRPVRRFDLDDTDEL